MKILIIDNHTKNLKALLKFMNGHLLTTINREDFNDHTPLNYELIVLTGGSQVAPVDNHQQVYSKEIALLKSTKLPVVGICLGCEIIAKAFGCSLKDLPHKEKGIFSINMHGNEISVYEALRFAIDKVSSEFEVIASSMSGPEIIKHKSKPRKCFAKKQMAKEFLILFSEI